MKQRNNSIPDNENNNNFRRVSAPGQQQDQGPMLTPAQTWFVLIAISIASVIGNLRPLNYYRITYWWFSYDLGFIKRGLMGTLLKPLGQTIGHYPAVYFASVLVLVATVIMLVSVATYVVISSRGSWASWLFATAFITLPGSIPSISMDLGRYDGILIILMFLSLGLVRSLKRGTHPLKCIGLIAIQVIGVLVHENYVVLAPPVLLFTAVVYFKTLPPGALIGIFFALAVSIAATFVIGLAGSITRYTADELFVLANSNLSFEPPMGAILVLTRSFSDNLERSVRFLTGFGGFNAIISVMFALIPLILLLSKVLVGTPKTSVFLLSAVSAAPLLLSFIATDIGRWGMYTTINAMTCALILLRSQIDSGHRTFLQRPVSSVAIFAVVIGIAFGGMDRMSGFYSIRYIIQILQRLVLRIPL